ncbi:hypothetical protein GKZ28_00780 [Clostridium chromiireducens]|uniref:Tail spike domain-containing protein n=1 Tax=Clostridium chromiireducens TaxID=225345 RepID=A0A964RIB2_9CLOT|nr:phage tail spike protein [Clostridium chromiireducens]MVX62234.1 hypothetical protein [Clostridium chromiireducens]
MIPILYDAHETNFNHNGIGLLIDTIYCEPEEERNESYELELAYPVGSFLYEEIQGNRIIKARANDRFGLQLFRIYYISKPLNGKIIVKAEHISYKLKDNFSETVNYEGNCQGALNALNNNAAFPTGFNFYSDISMSAKFTADKQNFWDCIKGSEGSIVDTYGNGPDIVRDNFNISVKQEGGEDNSILIAYRKNLTGLKCDEDWTGCITKIYPYAVKDDITNTITEKYVNSVHINRDPNPRIKAIDFSGEFESDEEITEVKLRQLASDYFINNNCDIPKLSYSAEIVALSKTEEYKDSSLSENIGLFDYLIIRHDLYGLDTKIKVIKTRYDSIKEKYLKIEVNFKKDNITKIVTNTNKKIDKTKTELKEDIKEANEKTDNLQVIMEARDSEIELSIANETEARVTAINVLDGKIALKVDEADFGTLIEQNSRSVVIAVHGESDNKVTVDSNGLSVTGGGFLFEDTNGEDILLAIPSGGIRIGNSSWSKDTSMDMINLGGSPLSQYFLLSNIAVNSSLDMNPFSTHYDITGVGDFDARYGEFYEDLYVDDTLFCESLEVVGGTKNCAILTENFGTRLINAYEMADNFFGDIGGGTIINGECVILVDVIFSECINTNVEYQVEIFEYKNRGSITDVERYSNYFIVRGVEGIEFGWELKAKRKHFENNRLEFSKKEGI